MYCIECSMEVCKASGLVRNRAITDAHERAAKEIQVVFDRAVLDL